MKTKDFLMVRHGWQSFFSLGSVTGFLLMATSAFADIAEERLSTGSHIFVPTAFSLNPAANPVNLTLFEIQQTKRDDKMNFVVNPGGGNQAAIEEKVSRKDLAIGGQYPLGGASLGLQYSEFRRAVVADNENRTDDNNELFVNRDYRMKFGIDFTPELRGAFTFHYTALKSDLAGSFDIGKDDRTHYSGTLSGYGVGVFYQLKMLGIGAYTHPPMRGKAMVEGEQKIITEPGLYGLHFDFRATPRANVAFTVDRWSYKHDERDSPTTSPVNQRNILLRGLDLSQFYHKTMSYGLAGEFAITPMIFLKGQYLRQDGVYLFDADHLPGDDKDLETRMRFPEYRIGAGIKNRDFIAELGFMLSKASQGTIKSDGGFGNIGSYSHKDTSINLSLGAAF